MRKRLLWNIVLNCLFLIVQMYAHQGLLFTLKGIVFVFSLQICKSTISMFFFFKRFKTDIFFCVPVYIFSSKCWIKVYSTTTNFLSSGPKWGLLFGFCSLLKLKWDALLYDIQKGFFLFLLKFHNSSLAVGYS